MTLDTENLLSSILASLDRIDYIKPEDIPNIDLYMDQVTTFMDKRLRSTARYPGEDKILTKTMINNYAKNDLLPPPVKKKYSKEHVLMLIFIYYYKGVLSISDIQNLLRPITEQYFQSDKELNLESIYRDVTKIGKDQIDSMKADVTEKYRLAEQSFAEAPEKDRDFLQKFAFISLLSFDAYVKKLLIEKLVDELADSGKPSSRGKGKESSPKEKPADETSA